ncbi:MAG TPA: hypothetical protein VK439_03785 [Rubrivivax sp.]|nr:hypothetical protein [Rubrivivax sp.]
MPALHRRSVSLHWTEGCLIGTEDNMSKALAALSLDPGKTQQLANAPENKER